MSLRAPDITAEIDVRSRRVTIWAGSLLGTIKRLNVPFDDVASLNLVRHDDGEGGSTFVVDLVLKDGAKCNLTTRLFGSSTIYEEQLAAICEATGFDMIGEAAPSTPSKSNPSWTGSVCEDHASLLSAKAIKSVAQRHQSGS
jgi:hypothetical protein